MWSKSISWRLIATLVVVALALFALYQKGYSAGHSDAERDGKTALSSLQSDFDVYKREQAERENAALRAWSTRYQAQVIKGHQNEADYLNQLEQLQAENHQLKGKINDVTQRWIDEKGKSRPIACVFTRGFVRQYNAALGLSSSTNVAGIVATASSGAGKASGRVEGIDPRLTASGVTQRGILDNITDNGEQCQIWRAQVNGLLNYIEGQTQ